ncbi:MAG: hypothetical protein ONB05_09265, partial [candidate division KSB1 bacterium]|nr:hypothetical protein [candidate division KSB1 bacterium]
WVTIMAIKIFQRQNYFVFWVTVIPAWGYPSLFQVGNNKKQKSSVTFKNPWETSMFIQISKIFE